MKIVKYLLAVSLLMVNITALPAFAESDSAQVAKGKQLFMLCQSCHNLEAGGSYRIGPHLQGIFDRPVAAVESFSYSEPLKKTDFRWDEDHLNEWLENPAVMVPGTFMSFMGIKNEEQRAAIIAYLKTL